MSDFYIGILIVIVMSTAISYTGNRWIDIFGSKAERCQMARTVGIGIQDFGKIIRNNCFYVDKTAFIREWWENQDDVTLITRPRRFGKTLAMSMLEHFFLWNMQIKVPYLKDSTYGKKRSTTASRAAIR